MTAETTLWLMCISGQLLIIVWALSDIKKILKDLRDKE